MPSATTRNDWLRLDDAGLLRACREERYRSSGPGGQRRNKVETAIRLHHDASGVSVQSQDARFLQENRVRALRRLRQRLATDVRTLFEPGLPPEFVAQTRNGALAVNARNPAYPIVVATALDALAAAAGSYADAAAALAITTSQLLKFLRADAEVWRAAERLRGE